MATTLNIQISDAEQAKILEAAAIAAPNATGAQIIAWAETTSKAALRAEVVAVLRGAEREAENVARRAEAAALDAAWVPTL